MTVAELIEKLQKIPGDYSVGRYKVSNPRCTFHLLDEVAVVNSKRRVSLGFDLAIGAELEEIREAFVVP